MFISKEVSQQVIGDFTPGDVVLFTMHTVTWQYLQLLHGQRSWKKKPVGQVMQGVAFPSPSEGSI